MADTSQKPRETVGPPKDGGVHDVTPPEETSKPPKRPKEA